MPDLYSDGHGHTFRPRARCPYSELVAGDPFAFDGDSAVYVRGHIPVAGVNEPLVAEIYHQIVTLLEPAGQGGC
jgi:hypothetical protein